MGLPFRDGDVFSQPIIPIDSWMAKIKKNGLRGQIGPFPTPRMSSLERDSSIRKQATKGGGCCITIAVCRQHIISQAEAEDEDEVRKAKRGKRLVRVFLFLGIGVEVPSWILHAVKLLGEAWPSSARLSRPFPSAGAPSTPPPTSAL